MTTTGTTCEIPTPTSCGSSLMPRSVRTDREPGLRARPVQVTASIFRRFEGCFASQEAGDGRIVHVDWFEFSPLDSVTGIEAIFVAQPTADRTY